MPIYQARIYIQSYDLLQSCYSANSKLQIALDKSTDALQKGDGVIIQLNEQLGHQQVVSGTWKQAFENEQGLRKTETKLLRKQKTKFVLITIGQAVVIVLLIL